MMRSGSLRNFLISACATVVSWRRDCLEKYPITWMEIKENAGESFEGDYHKNVPNKVLYACFCDDLYVWRRRTRGNISVLLFEHSV